MKNMSTFKWESWDTDWTDVYLLVDDSQYHVIETYGIDYEEQNDYEQSKTWVVDCTYNVTSEPVKQRNYMTGKSILKLYVRYLEQYIEENLDE